MERSSMQRPGPAWRTRTVRPRHGTGTTSCGSPASAHCQLPATNPDSLPTCSRPHARPRQSAGVEEEEKSRSRAHLCACPPAQQPHPPAAPRGLQPRVSDLGELCSRNFISAGDLSDMLENPPRFCPTRASQGAENYRGGAEWAPCVRLRRGGAGVVRRTSCKPACRSPHLRACGGAWAACHISRWSGQGGNLRPSALQPLRAPPPMAGTWTHFTGLTGDYWGFNGFGHVM